MVVLAFLLPVLSMVIFPLIVHNSISVMFIDNLCLLFANGVDIEIWAYFLGLRSLSRSNNEMPFSVSPRRRDSGNPLKRYVG